MTAPEGTVTVAVMPVPAELTTTAEAVGAGPEPFVKVTVAPLTKFVPATGKDVVEAPAFIELGETLLIVGGPEETELTVEVVCAVLLAVLVSPETVVAVAIRVWVLTEGIVRIARRGERFLRHREWNQGDRTDDRRFQSGSSD